MREIDASQVNAFTLQALGLDPATADISCVEAMAGCLRRAAGFLAPCSPRTLVDAVAQASRGLVEDEREFRDDVQDTLEALLAYGDFLELEEVDPERPGGTHCRLVYLAPPRFVMRHTGVALLIGTVPEEVLPLPPTMAHRVRHASYVRSLAPEADEDLRQLLTELGLDEMSMERWSRAPRSEKPAQHVERCNNALDASPRSGDLPGLSLIDPALPVTYYRGRWVEATIQTGRFVARRKQRYGADRWCYVGLERGEPARSLDFPNDDPTKRGCDEAWRLQAAIDATSGTPQQFRVLRPRVSDDYVLQFFSPVPMWARRRWDAIGEPMDGGGGCLFAYRLPDAEIDEELSYITNELWLVDAESCN